MTNLHVYSCRHWDWEELKRVNGRIVRGQKSNCNECGRVLIVLNVDEADPNVLTICEYHTVKEWP